MSSGEGERERERQREIMMMCLNDHGKDPFEILEETQKAQERKGMASGIMDLGKEEREKSEPRKEELC